jgi:hypothetical protein
MATIKPLFATETTVMSTELNSLTSGGSVAATAEQDNTTNRYLDGDFILDFAGAGATTGSVIIYLLEGAATGTLSTTTKSSNMRQIGSIELNGATAVRKKIRVDGLTKFWKPYVTNSAGANLAASGNTIKFTGINYSDT